jgi:hypothetical protein
MQDYRHVCRGCDLPHVPTATKPTCPRCGRVGLIGAIVLTGLVACGGADGPPRPDPTEVWPVGTYLADIDGRRFLLAVDGASVAVVNHSEITVRQTTWDAHGRLVVELRAPLGRATLTLYPGLRLRVVFPPLDRTVTVTPWVHAAQATPSRRTRVSA